LTPGPRLAIRPHGSVLLLHSMRLIYPLLWSRPDRKACREQSVNTAAALARLGVEVTLLLPRRTGDPEVDANQLRDYFHVTGDFRVEQAASRWVGDSLVTSAMWMRQLFGDPQLQRHDLIFSRIPAMLAAGGLSPLPFATDHYKPWPDAMPAIRPLIRRTAHHRRCLGFVLHSHFAAESYLRIGVPEEKLLVAHNGAKLSADQPRLSRTEARIALSLPIDRAIAVYAGRINAHKGLDQLLSMARLRPNVLFLLVGSEGEGPIEAEAAQLENVKVYPWQTPDSLPGYLDAADLLVIPPSSAPLEQFGNCVLPLKTFSYLAAGRPILGPALPDTAELLRDGDNAVLVPPDDASSAALALDRILEDDSFAQALGTAAAAAAEGLSWDSRADRIATFLETQLVRLR
jgi:glycosyltransferase involved in cell wall biosynthesis